MFNVKCTLLFISNEIIKSQLQNIANTYIKQFKVQLCISYCDNNSSVWCVWNYLLLFTLYDQIRNFMLCRLARSKCVLFYNLNAVIALNVCFTLLYTFSNITAQTLPDGIFFTVLLSLTNYFRIIMLILK